MTCSYSGFKTADEAEAAFYAAFATCDHKAMAAVWAEGKVVCIHPSANAIYGHDAVMRSWTAILSAAGVPDILFNVIKKTVDNSLAIHLVEEHITSGQGAAVVLASNVYQQFEQGWLMIEHHASQIPPQTETHTVQ